MLTGPSNDAGTPLGAPHYALRWVAVVVFCAGLAYFLGFTFALGGPWIPSSNVHENDLVVVQSNSLIVHAFNLSRLLFACALPIGAALELHRLHARTKLRLAIICGGFLQLLVVLELVWECGHGLRVLP